MSSLGGSLSSALPAPKYTGEHESLPSYAQPKGPRVLRAQEVDSSQIVLKRKGPPPYRQRAGWRPRSAEDYGDGGAFPEIPVSQYPLDMGRKGSGKSNALAVQVDGEGKVKYDAIAKQGHNEKRIVHASFKDLIPLRKQADAGEISLARPSAEEVAAQSEKTKNALAALVSGQVAAQKPKNVKGLSRKDPTYVRYTPANQMGDTSKKNDRIIKIVDKFQDPMEPPKHKHKKIPRGPPSPPAPVMHSPPRKLTAEEQEAWRLPAPVSNWKNPKGFTVPLDKRLAADGRGMQDMTINDKFAQFSEALSTADRHAREEVKQRAAMSQRLAEKEKLKKEEELLGLAAQARQAHGGGRRRGSSSERSGSSRSRSRSRSSSSGSSPRRNRSGERERERARREKKEEAKRQLRQQRMGAEKRMQVAAREQGRDISEKVALGLAKPTQSAESMWDSRLFNQTSGFDSGFNEDQHYDKPLFAAQDTINSIYRPSAGGAGDEDEEDGGAALEKATKANRFEVLGKVSKGFKGAGEGEARTGPVQFERDTGDPFNIDGLIKDATGADGAGQSGPKRYGMQEADDRASKRARVEDE